MTNKHRARRAFARVAAAATLVLTGTACTGSTGEGEAASTTSESGRPDRKAEQEQGEAFNRRLAECVTDAGIPMTWDEAEGAYRADHGGDVQTYRSIQEDCVEQLGGWPPAAPVTTEELEKLYELELDAYQCLIEHGYQPEPPSTKEEYVATYRTGESWYAFKPATPGGSIPDTECEQPDFADIEWCPELRSAPAHSGQPLPALHSFCRTRDRGIGNASDRRLRGRLSGSVGPRIAMLGGTLLCRGPCVRGRHGGPGSRSLLVAAPQPLPVVRAHGHN